MTHTISPVDAPDNAVEAVLARHHALMRAQTPAESCHAMTATDLSASGAQVFALRDAGGAVCAVGALKPFGSDAVEVKSMHVLAEHRGKGLGRVLLDRLLDEARAGGARFAYLETGSEAPFVAARALYKGAGFADCAPFNDYKPDPLSVFMTRAL